MTSLLTAAEYRNAPTGVSTSSLVPGGDQAAQDAELANVIARASAWCENVCDQPLVASTHIENRMCRYTVGGWLSVHPERSPLNQLVAASVGTHGGNLVAVSDLTGAFVDQQQWVIPTGGYGTFPLSLGGWRGGRVLVRLTSVSAWANTTLTVAPAANATSITVADASGFTPAVGTPAYDAPITIYDGENTETITVLSVSGKVLTLATGLQFTHAIGVAVSASPADLKQAAILATSAHIRQRGSDSMVVSPTAQPGTMLGADPMSGRDFYGARQILWPQYARVR